MPVSCCRKRISRAMAMGRYMEGSRASAHDMRLLWRHEAASEGAGPPCQWAPLCPGLHGVGQRSLSSLPQEMTQARERARGTRTQTTGSWIGGLRVGCCDTRIWGYRYPVP